MSYLPPPARRGDRITAGRQRSADEINRANQAVGAGDVRTHRTASGTTQVPTAAPPGVTWLKLTAAGAGAGLYTAHVVSPTGPTGAGFSEPATPRVVTGRESDLTTGLPIPSYVMSVFDAPTRLYVFQAETCPS
jgi:hypothetical protein